MGHRAARQDPLTDHLFDSIIRFALHWDLKSLVATIPMPRTLDGSVELDEWCGGVLGGTATATSAKAMLR